jgi:sterol desaturase/sphingolipid hydroxylase (fatty acid hydroxylase superfamily)
LFEAAVQPIVFGLGLGGFVEKAFNGTMWLMVGLLQLLVLVAVLVPLQRRFAVEPVTDKAAVRTDVIYTLIHRLGVFRVAMFLSVDPVIDSVLGSLRVVGMPTWHIDSIWPGVTDVAWVSLIVYIWCSILWTTGYTVASTAGNGGGACTPCTTRNVK